MSLPHLGANTRGAHISASQSQKYQTNNDQVDLLDDAMNGAVTLVVGISSGSDYDLGAQVFTENFAFRLQGEVGSPSLDGDFNFVVPATQRHFAVFNDTDHSCTVKADGSGGRTVTIPAGGRAFVYNDGEDIDEAGGIYDIAFFVSGAPTFDAVGGLFVAPRAFAIPAGAAGSRAYALTPPASGESDQVFDIQKNGSSIGSVTFPSLSNSGTFSFASAISFAVGDRLAVINSANPSPELAASDLANVAISFRASVV